MQNRIDALAQKLLRAEGLGSKSVSKKSEYKKMGILVSPPHDRLPVPSTPEGRANSPLSLGDPEYVEWVTVAPLHFIASNGSRCAPPKLYAKEGSAVRGDTRRTSSTRSKAFFSAFLLTNTEMNAVRRRLLRNPQFKGAEARKIKSEKQVSVLAFPEMPGFPHLEGERETLGEVYINRDFAKEEWKTIVALLAHGFLHLLGYRHGKKSDRMEMEEKERRLLRKVGCENPFQK